MKWRFSALAGDVEGSKLCLFSVIMPAKCVSSDSPRFHYRRVAFCFLPLAAILESLSQKLSTLITGCYFQKAKTAGFTNSTFPVNITKQFRRHTLMTITRKTSFVKVRKFKCP
jgi:hypothetical protein